MHNQPIPEEDEVDDMGFDSEEEKQQDAK